METYNDKYHPLFAGLHDMCNRSLGMYEVAMEKYGITGRAIDERCGELRAAYGNLEKMHENVLKAENTAGVFVMAEAIVFFVNPVAGLVLGLVTQIVKEAEKDTGADAHKYLHREAAAVCKDIERLMKEQPALLKDNDDLLKAWARNREAKTALQKELDSLKATLDKPIVRRKTVQAGVPSFLGTQISATRRLGDLSQFFKEGYRVVKVSEHDPNIIVVETTSGKRYEAFLHRGGIFIAEYGNDAVWRNGKGERFRLDAKGRLSKLPEQPMQIGETKRGHSLSPRNIGKAQ